jgi:hypothetical protein
VTALETQPDLVAPPTVARKTAGHTRDRRRHPRRRLLPGLALFALGPAFYHGMITPGWAPANYDLVTYFVPYREYLAHAWTQGRPLPLWNSGIFLGAPFLANIQAAVLYPPNLLLLLLRPDTAVSWLLALHLGLAGAGMYYYGLLGLRLRPVGSAVTALLFMLGALMVGQAAHLNQSNTLAWTPWLLLGTNRLATRPTAPRIAAVAVLVALVVLAGHPQQAYYTFLLAFLVAAGQLSVVLVKRRQTKRFVAGATALAGGATLGAGILALQLAATLELVRQSNRSGGLSLAVEAQGALPLRGMLDSILPNYVSEPPAESTMAVGSVALFLIALALVARWRRPGVAAWAVLGFAALLTAVGPKGHVYDLFFQLVPGFRLFREPARLVVFATVSTSVLAGHGVQVAQQLAAAWPRAEWRRRILRLLLSSCAMSLVPGVALAIMLLAHDPQRGPLKVFPAVIEPENVVLLFVLPLAAVSLVAVIVAAPSQLRAIALAALTLLVLGDLWLLEAPTYPTNPVPDSLYRTPSSAGALLPATDDQRYLTLALTPVQPAQPAPPGLSAGAAATYLSNRVLIDSAVPNVGMTSFPPDADGYDGGLLPLESYVRFRQPLLEPYQANVPDYTDRILASKVVDAAWLRRAGISVVLTPNGVDPNTAACPVCLVPSGSAGGMQAWRLVGQTPSRARLESGAPAAVVQDTGERVVVRLPANASGRLILADTNYPGWTATVDGRPAAIQPYGGYLRVVSIPPGARWVTFTYRPDWLAPGLLLSLASLLVTAILMAAPLIAARRRMASKMRTG